jgi:hypothetical protein
MPQVTYTVCTRRRYNHRLHTKQDPTSPRTNPILHALDPLHLLSTPHRTSTSKLELLPKHMVTHSLVLKYVVRRCLRSLDKHITRITPSVPNITIHTLPTTNPGPMSYWMGICRLTHFPSDAQVQTARYDTSIH